MIYDINRPACRFQIEQLHHLLRRKLPKIQKRVKPPEEVKTGRSQHGILNGPVTSEKLIMTGANPYSTLALHVRFWKVDADLSNQRRYLCFCLCNLQAVYIVTIAATNIISSRLISKCSRISTLDHY
jgi:hypothetical protein